ncbi:ANTH-domain-containing protein, partial [Meira miltonrushii]
MSRYEKLIKEATKPKPGAPKAKYIDPIIASSFSQDGSLQDMCKALSSRLNDSSSLVVMRSLIVIHTLIRNGGVDNVLSAMSGSGQGSLRLRNVIQGGNWQGYDAPRILSPYAAYLDDRIKAYRELRHDVIRAADAARTRGGDRSEGAESGLRLRRLTVEKGLLREVGVCQKVCSRLLDVFFAFFSGENTREELALTAFRMSLKDLLAVYAAINEGVINVLEHYFEMSKVDATNALEVYKRFCTHTEKIVAFLASARKISHHLNINIPNLRHAPVSLAGALKEYLDDPNFEKNRQEYKENKRVADGKGIKSASKNAEVKKGELPASSSKKSITIQEPSAEEKAKPVKPPTSNQALQDFFESIETDQMSMFGPGAQQQGFMMPQATGFQPAMMAPQMTGYNPFFGQQSNFIAPQQTAFLQQPQLTGFAQGGFLSPQMTGANPFRQSVMMQPTGGAFGAGNMFGMQPTGLP